MGRRRGSELGGLDGWIEGLGGGGGEESVAMGEWRGLGALSDSQS